MSDAKEIEEVRKKEQRIVNKPVDIEALRRRALLKQKFKEALASNDETLFVEAIIRDLGQTPGTEEYARSMKIWKDFHGRK